MPPIGCRCFEMARFSRCDEPFCEAKRTFAKKALEVRSWPTDDVRLVPVDGLY